MGNKIVMISEYDYAGSGYMIAEAVNLNSNNFVIPISIMPVDFPKGLKRMPALVASFKKRSLNDFSLHHFHTSLCFSDRDDHCLP